MADIQPSIVASLGGTDRLPWISIAAALGTTTILPMYVLSTCSWVEKLPLTGVRGAVAKPTGSSTSNISSIVRLSYSRWVAPSAAQHRRWTPSLSDVSSRALVSTLLGVHEKRVTGLIDITGGCGCYTSSITFISRLTTTRERPLYLAGILVVWGIGAVVGPVVGGAFAQSSTTWRWAFYINLFIAAATAPGLIWCVPSIDPDKIRFQEKLRKMDWIGIIIFCAGCTSFTMALSFGGVVYAFDSPQEIVLWTMSGVLLVATILLTIFHPAVQKDHRLYPVHLFKYKEINFLKIALFGAMGVLMVSLYYIPLLFQFTRDDSPLDAAVRLLPLCSR